MQVDENTVKKVLLQPPKFNQLGLSMMVTRLAGQYSRTPTPDVLRSAVTEINAFLTKFSSIMAKDFEILAKIRG